MTTFVSILISVFVFALAALNAYASRGQRIAQIAFVWLVPGLGAVLALHLVPGKPERGSGRYGSDNDDDLDNVTDFETSDGGGYTHAPHHDSHFGGGDMSSHH